MNTLLFATGNKHKVEELLALLPPSISIKSLRDIAWEKELDEPFFTLEENAKTKVEQLLARSQFENVFAEDSGLFIENLNGEPGVFSARYAGLEATDKDNIQKIINQLDFSVTNIAYFRTVIHLFFKGQNYVFKGECKGSIISTCRGDFGFGYDPIFIPENYENTFAELGPEIKNKISHRSKAVAQFINFFSEMA